MISRISRLSLFLFSLGAIAPASGEAADIDLDGNGLDDVWELLYNAGGLVADGDADGDGDSNVMEEEAGTDPLDRDSKLRVGNVELSGGEVTVTFAAQAGKRYKLLGGANADGTDFTELGSLDAISEAGEISATGLTDGIRFFQISAEDLDSDNDGIRDWAELQLTGYDPNDSNSRDPFVNDRVFLIRTLNAETGAFQMTVIDAEGFEDDGGAPAPLKVRVSRTGGVSPVTLFYTVEGSTDPEKEPAEEVDYAALSGMVEFANGETTHDVEIVPTADGIFEYPNSLIFSLDAHTDYELGAETSGELTIFDATNDPENQINFVGQMRPERNSETSASGYGFIKLNGKRDTALVTMRFSGLTTTQTAAHVHQATVAGDGISITNGPVVESLPLGQITDYAWEIRRTGANSPQDLIDALTAQNGRPPLYCNAHSMQYPAGEIWAFFGVTNGSTEFETPETPPAIEPLSGGDLTRDVQRFLTQATFGAREGEIQALVDDITNNHGGDRMAGYEAWIDSQYALDQTRLYDIAYFADQMEWDRLGLDPANLINNPPQPRQTNRQGGFYAIAMNAHDQLRQRVAFALSQILVISEVEGLVNSRHYGTAKYYDMLGNHTDGHFLQILRDVSKSPMMGQYLSSLKNSKATVDGQGNVIIAPDENYAREIMQLFSIGLLELHPDGSLILDENGLPSQTYTNEGITELARVFTGWSFSKRHGSKASGYPVEDNTNYFQNNGALYFQASWENPMKNFSAYHDQDPKTIFGQTLPANRNGWQDLNDATAILDSHPNTGPFIARLLIQRLVTSNPSAGYIYRVGKVMSDNDGGTGGQMKNVVKAILLDYEARSLANVEKVGYGKQKEPMMRYLQLMRALDSKSQLSLDMLTEHGYPAGQRDNFPEDATMIRWTSHLHSWFSQSHLRAPTVFNWFLPDQQVGGPLQEAGLVAPEFTATNEYQVIRWVNYARSLIVTTSGFGARELPNQRTDEDLNDPNGLLDNIKNDHTVNEFVALLNSYIAAGDTEEIATEKILDQLDLRLTGGRLKAKYGADTSGENPRNAILSQATYVYNPTNTNSHLWTIRDILYLLATSPEFITQK